MGFRLKPNEAGMVCRNYINVTGAGIALTAFNGSNQPGVYANHRIVTISTNTVQGSMHPIVVGATTKATVYNNSIIDGACYPFMYNVSFFPWDPF